MNSQSPEGLGVQNDMKLQIFLPSAPNPPIFNLGLADMLDEVEDLLFTVDVQGRVLSFKARNGVNLSHFKPSSLMVRDMVPARTRLKYEHAFSQVTDGSRFAMFEVMLSLPEKGAAWFEFRFLPIMDQNLALFIWNVSGYKALSKTVANAPIFINKMIEGWSRALYLRDFETEDHTRRVVATTMQLARRLGVPEYEMVHIRRGGELHDIGKIAIPDHILLKNGALSKEEREIMQKHPMIAAEIMEGIPQIERAMVIPRSHHEKWDGSGYPEGLKGESIPLFARIFALADVYDALTSDRPYRRAWSKADALAYIHTESGRYFDPSITPVFLDMLSEG